MNFLFPKFRRKFREIFVRNFRRPSLPVTDKMSIIFSGFPLQMDLICISPTAFQVIFDLNIQLHKAVINYIFDTRRFVPSP